METRETLTRVEAALHARLLAEARRLIDRGEERQAVEKLCLAASIGEGGAGEAARLLEKRGYRRHGREWLDRDGAVAREKAEDRRASNRRGELGLGSEFSLDRRQDVRIFTDHKSGEALPFTARLHRLVASLRAAHGRLFHLLEVVPPGENRLPKAGQRPGATVPGIDIVVFRQREDYESATGSRGTLGMFLPALAASYFYLGDPPPADLAPVLVHEVCHQLDFKALGLKFPPPWLEEGLAIWFEGSRVSPEGDLRREEGVPEVGRLPADQATRLREVCAPGGERWWGIERLVSMPDLRPLQGSEAVHDFHAQAGLLVSVLLEGGPERRGLFFVLAEKARAPDARPERAWRDFQEALKEQEMGLERLEAELRAAATAPRP